MKKVVFIKLGGSVITNKEVPMQVRRRVLRRLITEFVKAKEELEETIFIVGHGSGSFAHVPALRYKTMDGFMHSDSRIGMAITQDSAAQLNRVVVEACLDQNLPAVSLAMSNLVVTKNKKKIFWAEEILKQYLEKDLLPITYGDVLVDTKQGCTIWSTETIFSFLVEWFQSQDGFQVKKVIHVNEVAGVLDKSSQIIKKITPKSQEKIKKGISSTKGFDVTGGMWHKVEESLFLAERGIDTYIISGLKKNNLYRVLMNKSYEGTHVSKR